MCLTPIKIRNNSKVIYPDSFPRIYRFIPCGQCAECQQNKANEYYLRSYYQAKNTLSQGGFVLFDTLTYADNHLPTASRVLLDNLNLKTSSDFPDFSCFCRRDITLFLKRLRKKLPNSKTLSYYITSEYGTDDRYTHRPHYHCLFFYTGNLSPLELSKYISSSWCLGRTDGYPYKSQNYIESKRTITSSNQNYSFLVKYISKYLIKDSDFQNTLNSRKKQLAKYISSVDSQYVSSYPGKLHFRSLLRNITPFHLQSQNFGASLVSEISVDDLILNDGKITLPMTSQTKQQIKLPIYYFRRLFQYQKYDVFGNLKWEYNDTGRKYILTVNLNVVKKLSRVLQNNHDNFTPSQQKYILKLLDGRSYDDYSDYLLNRQFRCYDNYCCSSYCSLTSTYIKEHSIYYNKSKFIRNHSTPLDKFIRGYCYVLDNDSIVDYDSFFSKYIVTQNYSPSYRFFDDLFVYLYHININKNKQKNESFYKLQSLRKKHKSLLL